MRETKVKVWDKNLKSWVNPNEVLYINPDGAIETKRSGLVIVQFTGIKDKNGKEIYEEDIVEYENGCRILKGMCGTKKELRPSKYSTGVQAGWDKFEIIGNIYENPELLNRSPTAL